MRITIDSDDKGNVRVNTGEQGSEKPSLFQSTPDIPVIDGGSAPTHELERQRNVTASASTQSPQDREAELPLNPLRAGAAAAYQNPGNLRKMSADYVGTSAAAQEQSINTLDAGPAKVPESEKGTKRDKKR